MPVKNETSTRFKDELSIISPWAYVIASLGVVVVMCAFVFAKLMDKSGDKFFTLPVLLPVALLAAVVTACYVLLIGYINRDAGRRGMNRILWTLIAIFIPNGLGIVLYFVLRNPRPPHCPQCGATVESGFGFCPRCRYRLTPVCQHCQRTVHDGDKFCPFCGSDLAMTAASSAPVPQQI